MPRKYVLDHILLYIKIPNEKVNFFKKEMIGGVILQHTLSIQIYQTGIKEDIQNMLDFERFNPLLGKENI